MFLSLQIIMQLLSSEHRKIPAAPDYNGVLSITPHVRSTTPFFLVPHPPTAASPKDDISFSQGQRNRHHL